MSPSDPFALLGLAPGASVEEVRRARRRLAALLHPDRLGHLPAAARAASAARLAQVNRAADLALAAAGRPRQPPPAPVRTPAPPAARQPAEVVPLRCDPCAFVLHAEPAVAFPALVAAIARVGRVRRVEPPVVVEAVLGGPASCVCRLDLVAEAGATTVGLAVGPIAGRPAPGIDVVRDALVGAVNGA